MARTTILKAVMTVTLLLVAAACSHGNAASSDGRATIVRVIDGDTVVANIDGHEEHVRLIGIDTPNLAS